MRAGWRCNVCNPPTDRAPTELGGFRGGANRRIPSGGKLPCFARGRAAGLKPPRCQSRRGLRGALQSKPPRQPAQDQTDGRNDERSDFKREQLLHSVATLSSNLSSLLRLSESCAGWRGLDCKTPSQPRRLLTTRRLQPRSSDLRAKHGSFRRTESPGFARRGSASQLARVESEDYKRYIANLRGIECPEGRSDIITADVDKLFAPRFAALREPEKEKSVETELRLGARATRKRKNNTSVERRADTLPRNCWRLTRRKSATRTTVGEQRDSS